MGSRGDESREGTGGVGLCGPWCTYCLYLSELRTTGKLFFFFLWYWVLELRDFTLSYSASPIFVKGLS
jgi:hypothetical protein